MSLIALLLAIPFFLLVKTLKSSSAFNYYAKFTIYCLAATFIPLLHLPYFMLRPRNVLNMLWAKSCFLRLVLLIMRNIHSAPAFFLRYISAIIGLKFTRRGDVHMSKDQTCVIVSNHQTSLDFLGEERYRTHCDLSYLANTLVITNLFVGSRDVRYVKRR